MKLNKIVEVTGKIEVKTGIHIGAGNTEMHIGGTDNPVIKHPHTNEPYIPGSSLKGKIRSLLELKYGFLGQNGGPSTFKDAGDDENKKNIVKLFGDADSQKSENCGPTRISFFDCYINSECKKQLDEKRLPLTEIKAENVINRITGTAEHPRHIERIPSDIVFDFKFTVKIMEDDNEESFKNLLAEGLKLLQMDSLGGNGSRGYGKVEFKELKWDNKEWEI